ncbi:MAG: hypothetical protein KC609_16910 [Myxococcales bacterium]|nr:hypothetical protein [Myxococcales bacterium]
MTRMIKSKSIRVVASVFALVPFLLLTCIPASARADRRVLVKVYPAFKKEAKLAALLQSMFRLNLSAIEGVELADPAPVKRSGILSDAMSKVNQGISLLKQRKYSDAETELTSAVNSLSGALGIVKPYDLARALFALGLAKAMGGNDTVGVDAIKKAFLIEPRLANKMSMSGFSKKALGFIAKGQTEASGAEPGKVSLSTSPSSAEVWAQGKLLGISPVTNATLPQGSNYLIARLDGYKPGGVIAHVGGNTSKSITLTSMVDEKKYRLVGAKLLKQFRKPKAKVVRKLIAELRSFHNDPQDVVAMKYKRSGRTFTFDGLYSKGGSTKKVHFVLTLDASRHTQIQRFLARTLGSRVAPPPTPLIVSGPSPTIRRTRTTGPLVKNNTPTQTPPSDPTLIDPNNPLIQLPDDQKKKPSILKKWWFWTIIGVAVAGGVTAAVLLTRSKSTSTNKSGGLTITFH